MSRRVLSSFLAVLTLWSAFATQEQVTVGSAAASVDCSLAHSAPTNARRGDDLHVGSVADHHLDDQPGQMQGESAPDNPGLLPPDRMVLACSVGTPIPPRHVALHLPAPYLDGPQRPPRAHA